mgnify:CR=1 FL=1
MTTLHSGSRNWPILGDKDGKNAAKVASAATTGKIGLSVTASEASSAARPPSPTAAKPTGVDRPEARARCRCDCAEYDEMHDHETKSATNCGTMVSQ